MYSVELIKLIGKNFESTVYKPGSVVRFKCIEVLKIAKIQYAFRVMFFAIKKTKMLKMIRYFIMMVIRSNSRQGCCLYTSV